MRTALDGYEGGFRIGGRCIANLQYADDIVLIASSEEELQERVNRLHEAATLMGMKISAKLENVQLAIRWRPWRVCLKDTVAKGNVRTWIAGKRYIPQQKSG